MHFDKRKVLFSLSNDPRMMLPLTINFPNQIQCCVLHQIHCPLRDIGAWALRAGQADESGAAHTLQQRPHRLNPLAEKHLHRTTVAIAIEAIQVYAHHDGKAAVRHVTMEIMQAYAPGEGSGLGAGLVS